MVPSAYPPQAMQPQRPQESDPRGPCRTLRMLTQRVNDLLGVTFSGEDEYVVICCIEIIT